MSPKKQPESVDRSRTLTIPELEQSKAAVLNTLASPGSYTPEQTLKRRGPEGFWEVCC
jgi:hypothetical protein